MPIVAICGKIGSGKTTIATYIKGKYGYTEYSFATPIKQIGEILCFEEKELYGTQAEKLEINKHWDISGRTFLQKFGTNVCRDYLPQVIPSMEALWIKLFAIKYKRDPTVKYIISDNRFLDETDYIRELGGVVLKTVRKSEYKDDHASEMEIDKIKEDFLIDNDLLSLKEAEIEVDRIYEKTKSFSEIPF